MNSSELSLFVIVCIFIFNIFLYKKNVLKREKLKRKLDLFDELLPFIEISITKINNREKISIKEQVELYYKMKVFHNKVQHYGNREEIDIFEQYMTAFEDKNTELINKLFLELKMTIKKNTRKLFIYKES
jgi:hypothetical protein